MPAFLLEGSEPQRPGGLQSRGVAHRAGEDGETTRQQRRKGQRWRKGVRRTGLNKDFFLQAEGGGGHKVSQLSLDSVAREQFAGSGTQPSYTC